MIVLTNFHKNFLVNMGVNESKLTVIPNYLEVNNEEESFKKSQKEIVYAGRISTEKGVEELINAYVNSGLIGFSLKIIGKGPLYESLKNKYESKEIIFTDI